MYRAYSTYNDVIHDRQNALQIWTSTNRPSGGFDASPYRITPSLAGTVLDNEQYRLPTKDDMRALRYMWDDPADNPFIQTVAEWSRTNSTKWSTSNRSAFSYTGLDDTTRSLDYLNSLHSVNLITDYAPRMEGSRRYMGGDQPTVDVELEVMPHGHRATYRDRHIVLHGYDVSEEFYSPCYRNRPLPEVKDYRRTLYWNPNLMLDDKGHADVTLWNNSQSTSITVSAEGITPKGKVVTGISYPEDRVSEK